MAFKIQFGKRIKGLVIHGLPAEYPVLDERGVRAAAGIMLVMGITAFFHALLIKEYVFLQAFILLFTLEFGIRIFINPYYAPIFALGTALVQNQRKEWVGAIQKKFAWSMGFVMAGSMVFIALIFQIRGILPFAICLTCLFFLWAESALGVCVGCKMYSSLIKQGVIRPKVRAACAGGVCQVKPSIVKR